MCNECINFIKNMSLKDISIKRELSSGVYTEEWGCKWVRGVVLSLSTCVLNSICVKKNQYGISCILYIVEINRSKILCHTLSDVTHS